MNDKKEIKLSIITVCYNEENGIDNTCKSVISQTYKNYEWIVIDGNSKDNTLQIVNRYKDNITQLISEDDTGVYDAMNKGIGIAKGEYLLFLNGGDYLFADDVLKKVFVQKELNADILYGNCCVLYENKSELILDFTKKIDKYYFFDNCINHQSTFIKKSLFDKYGFYDQTYKILADYDKWLCFCKNNVDFKKLPIIISNFKGFDGLSSSEKTKNKTAEEKAEILKKYFKWYEIFWYRAKNKISFIVLSPDNFFKKYSNKILSGKLRQLVRKIWKFKNKVEFFIFSPIKFFKKYF